jgi:hypothetical protein
MRGKWTKYPLNFDNYYNAMITVYVLANGEGWPDIMNAAVTGAGVGVGPELLADPYAAWYFVAAIFIISCFFLDLFVGVIFMEFEKA